MKLRGIYFIMVSLLVSHCAKQTSPTGGPTDELPPTLIRSTPRHEQTNVKSSKIELEFDESIQLNNPREQIIITPTVGKKFETTFNKRRVTLDLKTDLQKNTTYNINFRESIQDLTEKNPATVKLAFSTGSYIDSLSINGKVQDATTEKLLVNFTVALAEVSDTFNIFKHPASWLTVTDSKGFFSLENLKAGNYILYAFDDKSKNLIVDSKSEQYGFKSQQINLTRNIDSLKLRTFKLDINKLKLISARTTFAYFNLRFSKSLVDYTITAPDNTIAIHSSLESDLTTIKLYNTIPDLDSLQIHVHALDSMNSTVDTLLYMKFPKKQATRDKFTSTVIKSIVTENNSELTAQIAFSKPVTKFIHDSTFIQVDSLTRIPLSPEDFTWENNLTKLTVLKKVDTKFLFAPDTTASKEKKTKPSASKKINSFVLAKGSIISIENDTAKLITTPLTYLTTEATAVIEVNVETSEDFIVQILNKAGKIVAEQKNKKAHTFENLSPDIYQLRIIVDLNKNGKWDPGNYQTKSEPEPVVYYRNSKGIKEVPVKANWQVGPLLITY